MEYESSDVPRSETDADAMPRRKKVVSIVDQLREYGNEGDFESEKLDDPTDALMGSDEKIEVLRQRVALGLSLWNPEDRRSFDDNDTD